MTIKRPMLWVLIATLIIGLTGAERAIGQTHSGFVTRAGRTLEGPAGPVRFAGTNMYWLGLSESPAVRYPSKYEVDDAMATAREMGLTVVRSHTLGDTVGCPLCLEPELGKFNPDAFAAIDYAVKSAADHGIRLVIPLVDHGAYYEGGIGTYAAWRGFDDPSRFYTEPQLIKDFEQHVSAVLNHVNPLTGLALKNDPTVLAWEEGNELAAPASWIDTVAGYIRGIDHHHLVAYGSLAGVQADALKTGVDIIDAHYYPLSVKALDTDVSAVAAAGKVFYAGEYDWTGRQGGDSLADFLPAIEADRRIAGDSFWSLFPHAATGGYVQHGDGYTLHYPGDTEDMALRAQLLRTHAYAMTRRPVPPHRAPGAPVIQPITGQGIDWTGATLGHRYQLQRSVFGATGPWSTICDLCASDNSTPWKDARQMGGTDWYRVRAFNVDGVPGPWSGVASVKVAEPKTITDDLNDLNLAYEHSAQLGIDHSNAAYFDGDAARADRHAADQEWITWRKTGLTSFRAVTYFWQGEAVVPFTVYTSADDATWTKADPVVTEGRTPPDESAWRVFTYELTGQSGVNFVKLVWNSTGNAWTPQLSQVTLTS